MTARMTLLGNHSVAVRGDLDAGRTLVPVITHSDPDIGPDTVPRQRAALHTGAMSAVPRNTQLCRATPEPPSTTHTAALVSLLPGSSPSDRTAPRRKEI
jgi:hypothetical protein